MSNPYYNDEAQPTEAEAQAAMAQLEGWRDDAVKRHPGAAPLREYLTANSRAKVMELAGDLADKLGAGEAPSGPTVTGGSPALGDYQGDNDELALLAQRAARTHSNADFSAWLQKKHEMAGVEYPGPIR